MTAADVRKAEKTKKKKKSTGEKIAWQPPLEYGEEENFETSAHKNEVWLVTTARMPKWNYRVSFQLKELHGMKVKEEYSKDISSGYISHN